MFDICISLSLIHILVVKNLAKNIKEVQISGLTDNLKIFVRVLSKNNTFKQKLIYDSKEKKNVNTATIDKYLGNSKSSNLEFRLSL